MGSSSSTLVSSSSVTSSSASNDGKKEEAFCDDPIIKVFVVTRKLTISEISLLAFAILFPTVGMPLFAVYSSVQEQFSANGIPATHTGLLLETSTGHYYLLEYSIDSKAHLYEVVYKLKKKEGDNQFDITQFDESDLAHIMLGHYPPLVDGSEYIEMCGSIWEKRRVRGEPPRGKTPNVAKREMQELMPRGYDLLKNEVCHTAQRRLRESWGILDD